MSLCYAINRAAPTRYQILNEEFQYVKPYEMYLKMHTWIGEYKSVFLKH